MRMLYFFLLFLPLSLSASDGWSRFSPLQPEDKWTSADKWSHFSFSVIMTVHNYYYINEFSSFNQQENRNLTVGISLTMGLSKEIIDFQKRKSIFSWKDLAFDIAGTAAGLILLQYME
jgi:putative lipoprotein